MSESSCIQPLKNPIYNLQQKTNYTLLQCYIDKFYKKAKNIKILQSFNRILFDILLSMINLYRSDTDSFIRNVSSFQTLQNLTEDNDSEELNFFCGSSNCSSPSILDNKDT